MSARAVPEGLAVCGHMPLSVEALARRGEIRTRVFVD
jgi:hypothetical protein